MIQQSINQLLGTAAIAAKLDPTSEKRHELYNLKKQEQVVAKQGQSAELKGSKQATDPDLLRTLGDIKQRSMELSMRRFQLDPNKQNFQRAVQQQQNYRRFNKFEELMLRQHEAKDQANGMIEATKAQKENFRQSILLNAQGQNILVPMEDTNNVNTKE